MALQEKHRWGADRHNQIRWSLGEQGAQVFDQRSFRTGLGKHRGFQGSLEEFDGSRCLPSQFRTEGRRYLSERRKISTERVKDQHSSDSLRISTFASPRYDDILGFLGYRRRA